MNRFFKKFVGQFVRKTVIKKYEENSRNVIKYEFNNVFR